MDLPARPIFTHGHHWHQQVLLFYASVCSSVNPIWHYPTNSLRKIQLLALNSVRWYIVLRGISLCKIAMVSHFLCIPRNFSMIVLDQVWGMTSLLLLSKDFIYWPEISWGDAQYHETDCYSKWLCSAIFAHPWKFTIYHDKLGPGRLLILGNARESHYSLKFVGIMQCTMNQITISNGHSQPVFAFSDLDQLCQGAVVLYTSCPWSL